MMEQAADDKIGQRAMEYGSSGVDDGSNEEGRDSSSKGEEGGDGCSECNGNGSGDGDGGGDGDGRYDGCVEGNGIVNAAMAAAATTKAAAMTQPQPPVNAKNQQSTINTAEVWRRPPADDNGAARATATAMATVMAKPTASTMATVEGNGWDEGNGVVDDATQNQERVVLN